MDVWYERVCSECWDSRIAGTMVAAAASRSVMFSEVKAGTESMKRVKGARFSQVMGPYVQCS